MCKVKANIALWMVISGLWLSSGCQDDPTPSVRLARVCLTKEPSLLEVHDNRHFFMECVSACSNHDQALCRAFRIHDNRCHLYTGILEEEETGGEFQSECDDVFYKVVSLYLPMCDKHQGYRTVLSPTETFCLYLVMQPRTTYDKATEFCQAHGGHMMFANSQSKLEAVTPYFPGRAIRLGVKYDRDAGAFLGQVKGQVLAVNSPLFRPGEPALPKRTRCVMTSTSGLNDIICDTKFRYACERFDFV